MSGVPVGTFQPQTWEIEQTGFYEAPPASAGRTALPGTAQQATERGTFPAGLTNEANNEQANSGSSGCRPVVAGSSDTGPTGQSGDNNGMAPIPDGGQINEKNQTQRTALPGGIVNRLVARGDAELRSVGGLPVVDGEDLVGATGVQPDAQARFSTQKTTASFVQPDAPIIENAHVQPDAQSVKTRSVQPDAQNGKSNRKKRIKPPTISGHGWKPSGLTGWELYRRKPAISANGKRSSQQDYIGYYSQKAIERLHDAKNKKTSNT